MYAGDVYILQDQRIVGMVGQIRFRRVPRLLMDRFFSPAASTTHTGTQPALDRVQQAKPAAARKPGVPNTGPLPTSHGAAVPGITIPQKPKEDADSPDISSEEQVSDESSDNTAISTPASSDQGSPDTGVVAQCLQVMARETGLGLESLTPDASFVELGIDSLMSLVLSEKFRAELGIEIKSSLFLECPTIGELKAWLEEYC